MKKALFIAGFICGCLFNAGGQGRDNIPLAGEELPQTKQDILGMEGKISLDLRNIDVIDALRFLAQKAGVNVVTTKAVTGRVTLKVDDVVVKDVFDVMLRANGLAYEKRENIYNVMTETEYKALYGKTFADVRQVKIFNLAYAIPEQIFNLADTLKSDIGRVLVSPESGKVVVMDSPEKIEVIEKAIESFEKENMVKVFDINYANAKEVANQLKSQLEAKKVGFVRADERSNQVIVQTLPERMDQIAELIKSLDTKTKEVLIEAKVVRVNFNKSLTDSIEWEGLFEAIRNDQGLTYVGSTPFTSVQGTSDPWRSRRTVLEGGQAPDGTEISGVDGVGSFPFSATTSQLSSSSPRTGLEQMHIGMVGVHDIDISLRKFQDIGETEILGTPRITVTNNQEAKLHVGEKQAYVTSTTTTGQTTSTVSEEITFIDVGLQFFVTPTINEDGYIVLKLKAELSSVVDTLETPTGNRIPILGTNLAETTVMTKDGTTIVIGGLRQTLTNKVERKTPLLADIPFIGKIFQSKRPSQTRSELLILITPTIVSGDILVGSVGSADRTLLKPVKTYGRKEHNEPISEASLVTLERIKGVKTGQ